MARGTRPGKLGKLLGRSAQTEVALRPQRARLNIEPLEDRRVLAVMAAIDPVTGDLEIDGGAQAEVAFLRLNADGDIEVVEEVTMMGNPTEVIRGTFDPADITSGNVIITMGNGGDQLTLPLIQNDGKSLQFSVDMQGGDNDVVFLQSNLVNGDDLPSLNLISNTIRVGGGTNLQYDTSGLTLDGDVVLDGSVTITANGGNFDASDASISASVDGADLTIETDKNALLGGMNDEADFHVDQLTVTSDGNVSFVDANVTTSVNSLSTSAATITIDHDVEVLEGPSTLESTGKLTFGDVTIDTHDGNLTLITGVTGADPFDIDADATFVSGAGATVFVRPQDAATPIDIGNPMVADPAALQVSPADLQRFTDFSVIEVGGMMQSGRIGVLQSLTLMTAPTDTDVDLHLHAGMGDILINAVVNVDGTITVTGDGNTTTINADMMGGALVFNDDVRIGTDADVITLSGGGGGVTFNNTVDSVDTQTNPLTVTTSGMGDITFGGAVGADDPLAALIANSAGVTRFNSTVVAGSLTTNVGGSTQLNGSVTTVGGQTYGDAVRIDAPLVVLTTTDSAVLFSSTVDSDANEDNALTVSTGTGNITFTGAVGAAMNGELGALIATSSGTTRFNSTVEAASLSTSMGGTTQINDDVTTTGSQSYGDDVRIDDNLQLMTTDAAVLFSGTVDSQSGETNDLTVDTGSGSITFTGAVGSAAGGDLGALITDSSGTTRFNSSVLAGSLAANGGGPIQLNGNVTTGGAQNYSGAVRIDAPLTLMTTNSQVLFSSTVNSQSGEANNLTVDTGAGNITFTGAIGAAAGGALGALAANSTGTTRFGSSVQAASLTTNMGGTTQLNGNVTTTGAQNYGDNVRVDANAVLSTTNSDVLFSGTVNSENAETNDLAITTGAGNVTFTGAVGGLAGGELGAVTINSANNVNVMSTFEAGSLVQVAGTGTTTIGGATTLSAAAGLDLSTAIIVINALVDTRTVGGTGVVRLEASDDVQINAEIRSGTGTVDVLADDDVTFAATGFIDSTSGVVTVQADADGDDNGAGGSVFMADGSRILAGSGRIVISADEDVTFSGLQTTSAAANAVQLTSTSGAIVDGGNTFRDVVAASGTLVIDAVTGIGSADAIETTVAGIDAANTGSGDIQIAELDNINVVQLSQVAAGNVVLTTGNGSITVTSGGSGVSAGTGTVTLTANGATSNIVLQQDVTTAAAGNVVLTAGQDILDDGNASTAITTGNLTLSARRNIGDITNFATGTGTPIDIALSGRLLLAQITDAGGDIFLRASGNLTADLNAINPDADGAATALVTATGNLDVGTFGGVVVTTGDNLGLLSGGTLTLPAGGYNVGGGDLRLRGDVNVQDGDQSLGTFTADSLEFVSGAVLATTLNTAVNTLTAEMTTLGTALTVLEQDGVLLESVVTNNGDLVVILVSPGDMLVREVDSGTALTALVATPFIFFGGNGAILDGDAPGPEDVDVTAGQVVLLASQGIGASGNALDLDAGILAALTLAGDINIADVGDGLTIGTVAGFVGVQITSGALGDDITVAATAPGGSLTVDAAVVTAGSGAVTLAAANDVSFTAVGQITAVLGNVLVDADGDISMTTGSQISTTGGMIELLAGQDIGIAQITTTTGNVDVDAGGGIMMADGSQIVSTSGAIDLLADASITVGRVQTSTNVTMTAGGAIIDGGDTGGADIMAAQTALSAASGIGSGNAIETQVSLLSAGNATSGDITITNSAPGVPLLLTIGDVGTLTGIENTAGGGAINVTNFGSMNVNSTVDSAGALTLTTENVLGMPSHLTVNAQVTASGAVELDAAANLNLNDTLAGNDVEGASVTGSAGGVVTFAPNVIVRSATGAVTDKRPVFDATTDLTLFPLAEVTVTLGRPGEENLTVTVNFDNQGMPQIQMHDVPGPGQAVAEFQQVMSLNDAVIDITVTVIDDPAITFFEGGVEVVADPMQFQFVNPVPAFTIDIPRAESPPIVSAVGLVAFVPTAEVVPIYQQSDFDDLHVPPDAPPSGDERIIIVEKIDDNGDVEKDRNGDDLQRRIIGDEAEDILADPSKLFQKLKAGRFRVWLKDGAEAERNLIWDVVLRDGKPEAGGEGTQRPPTELPVEPVPEVPPEATDPAADAAALDGAAATGTGPATAEVPAAPASNDNENAGDPVTLDAEGSAAGAAAVGALALPAALRRVAVHGRQMVRHVRSGVSALLRSISP